MRLHKRACLLFCFVVISGCGTQHNKDQLPSIAAPSKKTKDLPQSTTDGLATPIPKPISNTSNQKPISKKLSEPVNHSIKKSEIIPEENNTANDTFLAKEEASIQKSIEDAKIAAEKAAQQKAIEDAKIATEKAAQQKATEDAKIAAEKAAQQKATEDAKIAAEKAAQQKATEDAKIAAEKAAQQKAIEDAKIAAEKAAKLKAIEDTKIAAEKAAKLKAIEDAKIAAEKAEKLKAIEDAKKSNAQKQLSNQQYHLPSPSEAKLDSPTYTPLGAERKGNIDGTIPPWSGRMSGTPNGISYLKSGDPRPDPYANEKKMFTIFSDNYKEYETHLTEGQKKLLTKYPDSFYMHIYPTHRDGRYNMLFEQRTAYNHKHTKLVNGIDGLKQYTGGIPFPFPTNGAEAMWNSRVAHPQTTIMGVLDDIAIYLNGNSQMRRQLYSIEFPFSNPSTPVGSVDDQIGINAGLVHITVEKPDRQKGQMTVVHEALDQVTHDRKAWVYVPGSRRVRRAPTVGHDTPDGPGGLVTIDDSLGFNGAMERYNWTLIGKKEIYIPYHAYKFDDNTVDYDTLLQSAHANPEFMRYELHRVWVVEANLKSGANHVYAKRRFYIDEDSWQITLLESYDGRGDLWRVGILNTVYDYAVKGYVARAQMFHDLQTGAYITLRLINETAPSNLMGKPKGSKYYSPSNLRKMGTR